MPCTVISFSTGKQIVPEDSSAFFGPNTGCRVEILHPPSPSTSAFFVPLKELATAPEDKTNEDVGGEKSDGL
uniref:hypothetical protein n=1 Tax=Salmonella enterica TaxID=28901 RepID=UPI003298C4FF